MTKTRQDKTHQQRTALVLQVLDRYIIDRSTRYSSTPVDEVTIQQSYRQTLKGVPAEGAFLPAQQLQPPGLLLVVFLVVDPPVWNKTKRDAQGIGDVSEPKRSEIGYGNASIERIDSNKQAQGRERFVFTRFSRKI